MGTLNKWSCDYFLREAPTGCQALNLDSFPAHPQVPSLSYLS